MIKMAITKGRIEKEMCNLMQDKGFDVDTIKNKDRELFIKTKDNLEIIFMKANDVPYFIEKGKVDIGIVGKDTLDERDFSNYKELLDLKIGKCYFALAGFPEYSSKINKIATKYPNIAKRYFDKKQEEVEIVKMEGSIEIAPGLGMADGIIDLVETGATLKANGLTVIDKICDISTRLIANTESMENKADEINNIIGRLKC